METTPKIYWVCVIVGMLLGACVGWATRYSDMHAALARQQALLVKSGKWNPDQARREMRELQALAMDAKRRHQAESQPDSPEGKLVAHVLDAHIDGMDDVRSDHCALPRLQGSGSTGGAGIQPSRLPARTRRGRRSRSQEDESRRQAPRRSVLKQRVGHDRRVPVSAKTRSAVEIALPGPPAIGPAPVSRCHARARSAHGTRSGCPGTRRPPGRARPRRTQSASPAGTRRPSPRTFASRSRRGRAH